MNLSHTSRRMFVRTAGAALAGGFLADRSDAADHKDDAGPIAAHIGRELARIHRHMQRDGVRGEHLRGMASSLNLLSVAGLTTVVEQKIQREAKKRGVSGMISLEADEDAVREHLTKHHGMDLSRDRALPVLSPSERRVALNRFLVDGSFDRMVLRMADDLETRSDKVAVNSGAVHFRGVQADPFCHSQMIQDEMAAISYAASICSMIPAMWELAVILYTMYFTMVVGYNMICGY